MRNPLAGIERPLFWTLAFAAFALAAAGLAARAVDRAAGQYEQARTAYVIVRVEAPAGPEGIAAAELTLAQAPHVESAAPMTARRAAALLQQWGGGGVDAEDMPALPLIEVELAPAAPHADVAGDIEAALAQGGVTAEVIEAPDAVSGGGASDRLRRVALWGALGFGLVMAVIVSLAARTLAARRRELVTVMCDLGATQGQAAGRVSDEAALLGLQAGLVGGLLAGAAGALAILLVIPEASIETLPAMILPLDLVPIAAAPLVAAIAAGAGARAAAGQYHAKAARLG